MNPPKLIRLPNTDIYILVSSVLRVSFNKKLTNDTFFMRIYYHNQELPGECHFDTNNEEIARAMFENFIHDFNN